MRNAIRSWCHFKLKSFWYLGRPGVLLWSALALCLFALWIFHVLLSSSGSISVLERNHVLSQEFQKWEGSFCVSPLDHSRVWGCSGCAVLIQGIKSIYWGSWAAVGNDGSQYLQLLIKGSKWKLGITAGYKATIANEYSKPAFCLTGLRRASPGLQVSVISPVCDTFKGCWNPPTQRAAWNRSVCPHSPVPAGTFGTGKQAAEWGSVGLLISVSLFGNTYSVLTPVTWVPKWMWRTWQQGFLWLHLCSSLLPYKMKNALVQVKVTHSSELTSSSFPIHIW